MFSTEDAYYSFTHFQYHSSRLNWTFILAPMKLLRKENIRKRMLVIPGSRSAQRYKQFEAILWRCILWKHPVVVTSSRLREYYAAVTLSKYLPSNICVTSDEVHSYWERKPSHNTPLVSHDLVNDIALRYVGQECKETFKPFAGAKAKTRNL